jgi:hypothetical protein
MHNKVKFIGTAMKPVHERPDGLSVRQRRSKVVWNFAVPKVLLVCWFLRPRPRRMKGVLFADIQHIQRQYVHEAVEVWQVSDR